MGIFFNNTGNNIFKRYESWSWFSIYVFCYFENFVQNYNNLNWTYVFAKFACVMSIKLNKNNPILYQQIQLYPKRIIVFPYLMRGVFIIVARPISLLLINTSFCFISDQINIVIHSTKCQINNGGDDFSYHY